MERENGRQSFVSIPCFSSSAAGHLGLWASAQQAKEQGNDKNGEEDKEQDSSDISRRPCDPAEAKNGRDNGHD